MSGTPENGARDPATASTGDSIAMPDLAADPADEELLEFGRRLFAGPCSFVTGVAAGGDFPPGDLPEVAFAGRSNVGKSSLINALTGRSALARVSNTPGRTQQINFFRLGAEPPSSGQPALSLVDLPGYGYARAPKRDVDRWTALTRDYLRGRVSLRRVCLLVDSRHGLKDNDRTIMSLLEEAAVIYQVVLTKGDKLKAGELAAMVAATRQALSRRVAAHPLLVVTSAEKGTGIPRLRAELAEITRA